MNLFKFTRASNPTTKNHRQRGFSLIEGMVATAVIVVIAGVVIPQVYTEFQKAKLATCRAELDLMKAVAYDLGDGRYIPTPEEFWGEGFPSAEEGEYYYIVDSQDANKGHGNDLDGCDEDNPGNSPRCPGMDVKFVVFCAHDHGDLAKYCYATDDLPPTIVSFEGEDPLDFKSQKDKTQGDDPKPEGKKPKKPKKSKINSEIQQNRTWTHPPTAFCKRSAHRRGPFLFSPQKNCSPTPGAHTVSEKNGRNSGVFTYPSDPWFALG